MLNDVMRGPYQASYPPYYIYPCANIISNNTSFCTLGEREPHKIHVLQSVTIDICRRRCFIARSQLWQPVDLWLMWRKAAINTPSHLRWLYCEGHDSGDSLSYRYERKALDRFGRVVEHSLRTDGWCCLCLPRPSKGDVNRFPVRRQQRIDCF